MKTKFLFPFGLILITTLSLYAQIDGKKSLEPYTATDGTTFKVGDKVKLGSGTRESGAFKYIYQPANFLTGAPQDFLDSKFSNMQFDIKHFKIQGTKRSGYKTVAIINPHGGYNYVIDLDAAVEDKEITTDSNSAKKEVAQNAPSKADELLKLKTLLDQGAITQEEYDQEKKKILERQ